MPRFIQQSWFLIVLVSTLVLGYLLAESCRALAEMAWLKWAVVALTMLVMSLPVSFGSLKRAAIDFRTPALAIGLNSILIPLLAWPLSFLLGPDLGFGLIVASAAPCTLASAAVWTRRAGGNDSVAILVTIVTNSLCFIVTPFWVFTLLGEAVGTLDQVDFSGTFWKLLLLVVAPMGLGQLLRMFQPVAEWSGQQKKVLGVMAQVGILFVVLIGSVATAIRMTETVSEGGAAEIILAIAIVGGLHLLVLSIGIALSRSLGLERKEQIAVGFAGSQKTLMVGLSTAMELGVSIIPIIAYHSVQLVLDTLIADRWRRKEEPPE